MAYPFRITPSLGPDLTQVYPTGGTFYDGVPTASPSYQVGSVVRGVDGGEFHFVTASADIAATASTGTQVTLTQATHTVATGSGGFYTPAGVAIKNGDSFHVRRGAWNAIPA